MTVSGRLLGPVLALALPWSGGCDTSGTITISPELEVAFGFEDGLSPWQARTSGPLVDGGVEIVSAPVSQGTRSARIALEGGAGGAVWIQRELTVTPNITYDATLIFDLASSDGSADDYWTVLAGVTTTEPLAASLPVAGNTGRGNGGQPVWETRTRLTRIRTDETGRLWVILGIEGSSEGMRGYAFDAVEFRVQRVEG